MLRSSFLTLVLLAACDGQVVSVGRDSGPRLLDGNTAHDSARPDSSMSQPDVGAADAASPDAPALPPDADPPDADPPDVTPTGLACEGNVLRDAGRDVATYEDGAQCARALAAAGEGVVCAYFTADMPVGPGAYNDPGWRPMNVATGIGLGRFPHESVDNCLMATMAARGGVVCTNTGVGYKAAHIGTNMWCGSSSELSYCLEATLAAHDHYVCSFPTSGTGAEAGWSLTRIDAECDYIGTQTTLDACNAMIPR